MHCQDNEFFQGGQTAFSLVELLMALTIMAILLGLGIPALGSLRSAGALSKDTQLLADTLSFARSHALAKGRTVEVGMESESDGIFLVVGEREADGFHPVTQTRLLRAARMETISPVVALESRFPAVQNGQNRSFSWVIRFNNRGEARIRPNGIDREVILQILPNIGGQTPESVRDNRVDVIIHGLSGGISLVRDQLASAP